MESNWPPPRRSRLGSNPDMPPGAKVIVPPGGEKPPGAPLPPGTLKPAGGEKPPGLGPLPPEMAFICCSLNCENNSRVTWPLLTPRSFRY
jgi:hypothetical protein